MSYVQRFVNDGRLLDNIKDKIIEIQNSFKIIAELSNIGTNGNDQNTVNITEDYNKLKIILEQLQTKMSTLVQENQKFNNNLIEYEQKVIEEQNNSQEGEDKAHKANKEFNRVFECLSINQKENEELKMKLNSFKNQTRIINDDIYDYKQRNQQLQREFDIIENKYKQLLSEKPNQKDMLKSPLIVKSIHSIISKQTEQLKLKLLQLQIENDNLKAEMAHNQVDFKVIENKNEMIQRLDEKIKSILKEKTISEEQSLLNLQQFRNFK